MDEHEKTLLERYKDYDFTADSDDPEFLRILAAASRWLGDDEARCLAEIYAHGSGVEKDMDKSKYWAIREREHYRDFVRIREVCP